MNYLGDIGLGLINAVGTGWLIVDWVIRILALFIVPRNRKPTAGMAWLLFIFLFPLFGMLIFLIIGNPKLPKSRKNAQKTLTKIIRETVKDYRKKQNTDHLLTAKAPEQYTELAKLNEFLGGLPVFGGNKIKSLPEYDDVIKLMTKDIDKAKYHVNLEYFIIALDETTEPIFEAIARATKRGVIVRVMYDWLSIIRYPNHRQIKKRLETDGAIVQPMLPLRLPGRGYVRPDLRNHRKLTIIDGQIGYTGSLNLITRNYHRKDKIYYDEMVVRVEGPIVYQLSGVFISDWFSETGELLTYKDFGGQPPVIESKGTTLAQVLPSGPGYYDENNLKAFTSLIHQAKKKVTIVNPYFIPDDALTTAITSATNRGVNVVMINSEVMDQLMVGHAQRSFYEALMRANVNIHLYKAPILLHSKFMIVDDEVVVIGSSNLDLRSFFLNLEVSLFCYDAKLAKEFNKVADKYLARSSKVNLKTWMRRPKTQKLLDNLARLTSAIQ